MKKRRKKDMVTVFKEFTVFWGGQGWGEVRPIHVPESKKDEAGYDRGETIEQKRD